MSRPLLSPLTRAVLQPDGANLLRDADGRRWPVIDGIPYLRVGRDALAAEVVARLQSGDREGALVLLLADQDDWWTGPEPDPSEILELVRARDRTGLRHAMAALAFGRVGDYFAHRWSDPTFLAGLALIEAHWRPTRTAFELACGIGHYGRDLARRGIAVTGADVVFAKLWLARHWVVPAETRLICFDAAAPWPVAEERFDLVFCHDAFYFLEPKAEILAALRALAGPGGRVAVGHVHNSASDNLSSGHAVSAPDIARLFPDATVYDDAELTRALVERRSPRSAPPAELDGVEAFSIEDASRGVSAADLSGGLTMPVADAALRLNPLFRPRDGGMAIEWPSPRYQSEYEPRTTLPQSLTRAESERLSAVVLRRDASGIDEAVRRRILVDLPERW